MRPPAALAGRLDVSRETGEKLAAYVALLEKWQTRVNLVSASTLPDIWSRHIWDSAQLAPLVPANTRRILDVGSGAGFPGLVLAALCDAECHLVAEPEVGVQLTCSTCSSTAALEFQLERFPMLCLHMF